jgi:hypothetical protein
LATRMVTSGLFHTIGLLSHSDAFLHQEVRS